MSLGEARTAALAAMALAAKGIDPKDDNAEPATGKTFNQVADLYYDALRTEKRLAASTLAEYERLLHRARAAWGTRSIDSILKKDVNARSIKFRASACALTPPPMTAARSPGPIIY